MKTRFLLLPKLGPAFCPLLLLLFAPPSLPGQQPAAVIRNVTPPVWQADDVLWSRDVQPHNKIDDTIDNSTNQVFDVVVNFKRCVTDNDIAMLNGPNTNRVQMRLKYLSSVAVQGLTKPEIREFASVPDIAFIEQQFGFGASLNVSVPTICVRPGSVSCAGNARALGFDGTGINIAVIDTGVDTAHAAFAATPIVGLYNAITHTFGNAPDDVGHGTHVASIALGQATVNEGEGVAPRAGLIAVKVIDAATVFCSASAISWPRVVDGLQTVYDQRAAWNVKVINMSLGQCSAGSCFTPSDGLDAFSQLVNLAESMGIVVVAAAGNCGPANVGLATPAAASRAIAVAASDDRATPDRTDDTIANFSNRGPRGSDGDMDPHDELKPEVTAPGVNITAAKAGTPNGAVSFSGTSMAAPHVAGLAALIMQARPGINPASVKEIIITTAEPHGPASRPGDDPVWNDAWGWGLVNGFAAVSVVSRADLTFPSYPPPISWESPDISISPDPAKVGQLNTATVQIQNRGPNPASNVRVDFGVYVFSASPPQFHHIGTFLIPNIASGATLPAHVDWVPWSSDHQCIKVEIAYGPDTDFSNNTAQRNLTVQMSPVRFMVQNTYSETPAVINLIPTLGTNATGTNWTFTLEPRTVTLGANDCPVPVTAELFPGPGARPGERQTLHVAAVIDTFFGPITLGGVTIAAVKPAPPDIAVAPANQQIPCGGTATFSVSTTGTEPLSYQWQQNGVDLAGATSSALSIYAAGPADAGSYTVLVTNSAGRVQAGPATLTVLPGPAPRLAVSLHGSNVVLIQWPHTCSDYDLQESSSLAVSDNWTPAVATVEPQGNVNIATVPLQPTGNRFYRLLQRTPGTIPLQTPAQPALVYTDLDPMPIGATGVTTVAWQPIANSLTVALEAQIRFAAQQSLQARSLLGTRYAYIDTSPVELAKGGTNTSGAPLQTLVTFFSHSFNNAVLVYMSGTNVLDATTSTNQPPEGADEVAAALDLARVDPRLAGSVQGLVGTGLLVVVDNPAQPGYGHRLIDVTFSMPGEAGPRYAALVDLTAQEVLAVTTNP